jgi:hypothetical protein
MKLLKLLAACLLVGSQITLLPAQIFSGGFRTNFGVDADLYANRLENGIGIASGLDDWFKLFGDTGSGFGFLDTTNSAAIYNFYTIPANANTVFERRSLFGYQSTFSGPTTANKKFIDALFARETFGGTVSGNNLSDSTVYVIASKNGEAPSIWSPGVGNVANKNDIIDIYGLCQRNGLTYLDSIYVFAGLTLRSNTGARYVDFEFFQAPVGFHPKPTPVFTDGGALEEGHTAFKFNSTGKPVKAGDMIFAVEIGSGGIQVFEMRIWMRKDSFALYKANPSAYPNLPFLMGESIDGGSSRSVYGYAQIKPKNNKPFDIVAVSNIAQTTAPPWGAFFNDVYGTFYGIDQFFEIGVNLTQVGLDPLAINNDPSPCARAFSKYMIKTRASNAFTAQLQDFAGPYDFGGPPDLKLAINSTSSLLTCDSTSTTLKANVTNGNSPENYYYTWKLGSTVVAQGVGVLNYRTSTPGTYTLEIAALAGCSALVTGTYIVTQDNTPPAVPTGNTEVKFCTGSSLKSISVTQPASGFQINWFAASSGGASLGTGNIFLPSSAGTYYAETKKLSTGCVSSRVPVMLTAVSTPVISATPKRPCFGQTNGSITTSIAGGTSPFSYAWNVGQTTSSLTNIGSGNYTVVAKDVNNCADTLAVVVPVSASISLSLTPTQVLCNGGSSGAVAAVASGGSGTLTYLWSNAATTSSITGLSIGTYSVTVTDGVPCSVSGTITITQPAALSASSVETDKSCSDKNNGSIDVTVSGGKTPYTFNWSNSLGTAEDVIGLSAGSYAVTVTDANGCTTTLTETIASPSALFAPATVTPVACFGQSTGTISISATGGNSGYTYLWADGSTGATRTNLPAGSYVLSLKDSKNCQKDTTIVVSQPTAALSLTSMVTNDSCFGAGKGAVDATVTGGTVGSGYTYLWSNNATTEDINSLLKGSYTLTVTDANGCTTSLNNAVTEPQKLAVTGVITDATCTPSMRNANGSITLTGSGGTTPYSYIWSGPSSYTSTSNPITNLAVGTYSVTVEDKNKCTATWTGIVKETSPALVPPTNIISNN